MSLLDLVEVEDNENQETLNRKLASMEVEEPQPQPPAQPQPDPLIEYARRAGNYAAQKEREVRQAGQQLTKVQSQLNQEKKKVATLRKQIPPKKPIAPAPPTPPRREPAVLKPSARIGNPSRKATRLKNTYPGKSVSFMGAGIPSSLPGKIGKKPRRY
jgi:hypothetical protein